MHIYSTYRPQNQILPQGNLSEIFSYTFSAKEKDAETGYSYFGSRYYTSNLSIWLSVDPMAAKYPSLSPYVYCANNPIKLVDPNGDTLRFAEGVSQEFKEQFAQVVKFMNAKRTAGFLAKLHRSRITFYIAEYKGLGKYSPKNNTIYWDPEAGALLDNGVRLSPATVLNHEADHALQDAENPRQLLKDSKTTDESYQNLEEKRVITGSEQRTALKHGEIKKGQVTRTNHKASYYRTKSPTSTEENTNL